MNKKLIPWGLIFLLPGIYWHMIKKILFHRKESKIHPVLKLNDMAFVNLQKLRSRQVRNKLHGSGDDR